ncbi:gamma carbonic anhydrase family protein [Halocella sp. SP3-1]|uniref:gamma carbonic anhydrase family protein n=1 Tax=Halocella sp. SP3-1 TaxID=2382161 RepID=UPI000F75447C|nr:gamma carbonic anhydrase family protein [Halocella sp. SP3-1]AZO94784.1 gamma carbonic anhydrase family protein [Halocella sp. SP3-1]
MLQVFNGKIPEIGNEVFIAAGCQVIGDVKILKGSSVWYNAVIRGDFNQIKIGALTNIQDNAVLHVDKNKPLLIGNNITIGHGAKLHSCKIEDSCLIGMGAIVLNGAVIGEKSIISAGAIILENQKIPPRSLVVGIPGKIIRKLEEQEIIDIKKSAEDYHKLALEYLP